MITNSGPASARDATRSGLTIGFLFLLTQLPALYPIAKFFPAPLTTGPAFLLLALVGIILVVSPPRIVSAVMLGPWPTGVVALSMTMAALVIYPYADELKLQGRGSDADEALILAGRALWELRNPYIALTSLGNAIAPGAGWAVIAAPFSASGLYGMFFPVTLAATIACLRKSGFSWLPINQLMLLMASSLSIWQQIATGGDYPPFTLLMLCTALVLQSVSVGSLVLTAFVLFVGALSTFRLPFLILPLLFAIGLWCSFPRRAAIVGCGGLTMAIFLHAIFYVLTPKYPPLQLLVNKTAGTFSSVGLLLGTIICAGTGLLMLRNVCSWGWPMHFAVGLGVPWGLVIAADLWSRSGDLSNWGVSTYLIWVMPFAILAVIVPKQQEAARS